MILNVNSAEIYVEEAGEDNNKTVVMIHGNCHDTRTWQKQVDVLSLGFNVITYDIRGTGKSERLPNIPFSHVSDLEGLFNAKGLMEAYLVGSSLGGLIATNFAYQHAHRVKGMVLESPDMVGGLVEEEYVRFIASLKLGMRTGGAEKAAHRFLNSQLMRKPMSKPEVSPLMKSMVASYNFEVFKEGVPNGLKKPMSRLELPDIKAPTLIMYGEDDIETFRSNAKILSSEIRDSGLIGFDDCGHVPHLEVPNLFNSRIIQFFDSLR